MIEDLTFYLRICLLEKEDDRRRLNGILKREDQSFGGRVKKRVCREEIRIGLILRVVRELHRKLLADEFSFLVFEIPFRRRSEREVLSFGTADEHHLARSSVCVRRCRDRYLIHIRRDRRERLTFERGHQGITEVTKRDREITELLCHGNERVIRVVIRNCQRQSGLLVSRLLPFVYEILDELTVAADHVVKSDRALFTGLCFFQNGQFFRCLLKDRKDGTDDFLFGKLRDVFIAGKHLLFVFHAMRQTEVFKLLDRVEIDRDETGLEIRNDRRDIPAERRHIQDRS